MTGGRWETEPFPPPTKEVLVRYSGRFKESHTSGSHGTRTYFNWTAHGRETAWFAMDSPYAGWTVSGGVSCSDPGNWSLQFYDPPTAPVSFPGSTMPLDDGMELLFRVPTAGSYAADITLAAGTLTVGPTWDTNQEFDRSGTLPLGTLQPGVIQRLWIDALGEDQARWTIRIRPA
jgi:hypothetical protein